MSTKTKPAAKLAELEAAAHKARQERDRVRRDAQSHGEKLRALDAELGYLARSDASQFDGDGQPVAKSRAAEIRSQIDSASTARWGDLLDGAEQTVRRAEGAVAEHRAEHAVELATEEFRRGEELTAALSIEAERVLESIGELDGVNGRLIGIVAACPGKIDGRDIASDPRLGELRQLLSDHETFCAPRSRSLTPLVAEHPPALLSAGGGWIGGGHGGVNYSPEQPPRVEAGR